MPLERGFSVKENDGFTQKSQGFSGSENRDKTGDTHLEPGTPTHLIRAEEKMGFPDLPAWPWNRTKSSIERESSSERI